MDVYNQYKMKALSIELIKKYVKSFYRSLYLNTPIFLLIDFIVSGKVPNGFSANFWIVFIILSVLTTSYCIYFPLKAIKRYKNLVKSFIIEEDAFIKMTLFDDKVITIEKYKIKDASFFIGNIEKQCKAVCDTDVESSFFIIPEFFDVLPAIIN